MPAPSFNRRSGALSLPTTTTGETTLESLDPAKKILLDLFKVAIETELGPRWVAAAGDTPLAGRDVVADSIDVEPTAELLRHQSTLFPLLCVYRDGEATAEEFSLSIERITQRWGVDYVLGPLDAAGQRKLNAALIAVAKIITEVVKAGGHPEYAMAPGGAQPNQVLIGSGAGTCEFSDVRVVNWTTGQASFAAEGQGPTYWWLTIQLETTEDDGPDDPTLGREELEGGTFTWGTGNEGGVIEELFEDEQTFPEDDDEGGDGDED
jgi:hypothetical protein